MHAISYQLKRAHLLDVGMGQRIFDGTKPQDDPDFDGVVDMTPARFDILYLVLGRERQTNEWRHSIAMMELTRRLGLSRATISRSIKRMGQLGLVTCSLAAFSRRNKVVTLTEAGLARIQKAIDLIIGEGRVATHYADFVRRRASVSKSGDTMRSVVGWVKQTWQHVRDIALHHRDWAEPMYLPVAADAPCLGVASAPS